MEQSLVIPGVVKRRHCSLYCSKVHCKCEYKRACIAVRVDCLCRVAVLHLPAGFPLTELKGMRQWGRWRKEGGWVGCLYKCIRSILSYGLRGERDGECGGTWLDVCDSAADEERGLAAQQEMMMSGGSQEGSAFPTGLSRLGLIWCHH